MFRRSYLKMEEEAGEAGTAAGGLGAPEQTGEDIAPEITPDENVDMSGVPEWARSLSVDKEILMDPSLKAINDLDSLTKSYVHAQRKIGQKGVLIPGENSTKEEWDTFYQKTGVPLEERDYQSKIEFPGQDEGAAFDEEFNNEFVRKAHELRIRPDQATQMYQFFNEQAKNRTESFQHNVEEERQTQLNQLRDTLGEDAYNVQLSKAQKLINEELGAEFQSYLRDTGIGKDPKIVEAFMKLSSKLYNEEPIPRDGQSMAMTKDQMNQEINLALGNPEDPYHKPNHPDHKRRVNEIQKYFAKMEK